MRVMRGFTLIEVLVVLAITATLTALVVLRLGDLKNPDDPQRVLERIAARVDHQCEQALFQARPRGLRFSELGFDAWQSTSEGWQPLPQSGPDRAQAFPPSLGIELELGGYAVDLADVDTSIDFQAFDPQSEQARSVRPQVICHPLGELTPFRLSLSSPGQGRSSRRWVLDGEASGKLIYELPES